ncbi:hypothetical protein KSS87_004024 [Heliosperma pusillum]|nr:hypothetical protein KSS87_004024 [Heliosperma pusillum]
MFFSRETFPTNLSRLKSLEVHCNNGQSVQRSAASASDNLRLPELSFNRLQPSDQECDGLLRRHFGRYLAREAFLDEEFWTAAWLRAEAHWESVSYMRHIDVHKRKFAEQEFYALKRRCSGLDGNSLRCFCLVAVKREDKNARRTVLNSVVGTLDLSIRQFLQGETYPGEKKKSSAVLACQEPFGLHRYAYIANVCVPKFARRQRIASNMLHLAMDVATSAGTAFPLATSVIFGVCFIIIQAFKCMVQGMKQLFVHVNADNNAAQDLYSKTGFKVRHSFLWA